VIASRIVRRGQVAFVDIADEEPAAGEVVVRPLCLSLCGSDIYHYLYMEDSAYPQPVGSSGHEMIGVVDKIGEGVDGLRVGEAALTLSPGHTAMTERYRAEAEYVLPLPEGSRTEELLMAQQLGTVVYAARRLPNLVGSVAAVIGQGSAGILWSQMLRRLGCRSVVVMDLLDSRVKAGRRYGADEAFNNADRDPVEAVQEATGGAGADIVVEAAGEPESINLAARLVREKGIIYYFGVPRSRAFAFDYATFFRTYAVTFSIGASMLEPGKGSFRQALDLIASGGVDVKGMVTHRFDLRELERAYDLARTGADGALKVMIRMPS
jgi:L-iditol 2-dehydrogenase